MFKALGSIWAVIASFFGSLQDATVSLDNIVNETLLASDLSLAKKSQEYKEQRARLSIDDKEINSMLEKIRNRRNPDYKSDDE